MAKHPPDSRILEYCDPCDADTPHAVQIELRSEARASENAAFSREPYRVSECKDCGSRTATRMNDA